MTSYKDLVSQFGSIGTKYLSGYLTPLKEEMVRSNLNILFEVYVGKMVLSTVVAFGAVLISSSIVFATIFRIPVLLSIAIAFVAAVATAFGVLTIYHSYPFQLITSKKASLQTSMPFAVSHMGAIASSGVPPFVIFKLLASIQEYGEVANEAKRIVRNVEAFGMDLTSAIKNVADRTPSVEFKQFLYGIVSITETGGDLKTYMENASKEALIDYRLKRQKYMQVLSTYADFYTAVLIAAPLFFISVLSIMSLIGGEILGMDIPTAIKVGVYVLMPALNTAFILFIHFTQPGG